MAEGGYERLPEWDEDPDVPNDDNDDERTSFIPFDSADQTGPSFPNGASTPAPEFQTEQREKDGLLYELPSLSSTTLAAEGEIDKEFPNADKNKIKFMMDDKGRTKVGLISPKKPYYPLLTQVPGKSGEYRVNPQLPKEVLRALGASRRQTIQEEIGRLSEGILENKKVAEDTSKGGAERNAARERAQRQISSRIDLQRQLGQLKAGEYTRDGGGQSIPLEVFQKNEEKRQEREEQLLQEKQEQEKVINDERAPILGKEKAEKEIEEINKKLNEIENEREIEAEGLSPRDRLREKVKAIFKKYGVTVTAIFLAAGVTIGAVLGTITNALKKLGTDLGNGLKTLGAKAASALPGLIGAIVSFLFKAAGSAIGFLAEHTWLLILAVVAFLFQKLMKRS